MGWPELAGAASALPVFTVESLGFHVDATQSPAGTSISGSVTFFASDPGLTFGLDVSAANSNPGGGWVITGQQNDSPVKVTDILAHYLPNNWSVSGLPEFEVTGFSAEIHTGSAAPGPHYIIGGTVDAFSIPILDGTIEATASFGNLLSEGGQTGAVAAAAQDGAPALPFGHVSAEIQWHGITLDVGYDYTPGKQSYQITWDGLTADLKQQPVDGAQGSTEHWMADLTFSDSVTLGSMVETFVSWVTGYQFGLAAPWNLLDDISLSGLTLTYDFTAGTVKFTVDVGPIELGFCTINSIDLTYNSDPGAERREGPGHHRHHLRMARRAPPELGRDRPQLHAGPARRRQRVLRPAAAGHGTARARAGHQQRDDRPGRDHGSRRPVGPVRPEPARGHLRPRVVMAGRHRLRRHEVRPERGRLRRDPAGGVRRPGPVRAAPGAGGQAGEDPAGLDFEVLYRKISDTIGVYQAQIALPTAIRTFQASVFTIGFRSSPSPSTPTATSRSTSASPGTATSPGRSPSRASSRPASR